MSREQFQTLTEPMYYILLALTNECCGVDIMQRVTELSGSRVVVGPGTLYSLLSRFAEEKLISETASDGRKRSYVITSAGKELLITEYNRLKKLIDDGKDIIEEIVL